MLKKVRVDQKGDTDYLPGQFVDRFEFAQDQRRDHRQGRRGRGVRGHHPRHHEGLAEHGLVPLGRLLPGDDEGPDRRRARGQDRPPERPEGERDHREAHPGGDGPEALPADRDRAGGAAAPRDGRGRPARPGRDRRGARARRRRRPGRLRLGVQRGHRVARGHRHRRHATRASPRSSRTSTSPRTRRSGKPPRPTLQCCGPRATGARSRVRAHHPSRAPGRQRRGPRTCQLLRPSTEDLRNRSATSCEFGHISGSSRDRDYRRPGLLMVQACQRDADCRRAASARRTPLRPAPLTTPTLIS